MRVMGLGMMAVLLSGCMNFYLPTTPINPLDAVPVPGRRIFTPVSTSTAGGRVLVQFVRDAGSTDLYGAVYLNIDGRDYAMIGAGEKFSLALPAGRHTFILKSAKGSGSAMFGNKTVTTVEQLDSKQVYNYRIGFFDGSNLQIMPWNPR